MITDAGESFRTKIEPFSPRSSPRRQDTTGTLKTTISLGKNPSIVYSGPFYLMKEPSGENELTGAVNLMSHYGLEHTYSKFSGSKRMKESLSSFLPHLPGNIDTLGKQNNSSLGSLINKPPICGKELLPLSSQQMLGFRLHPTPLAPEYLEDHHAWAQRRHKNKRKKSKYKIMDSVFQESIDLSLSADTHEKKHKKQKRHNNDDDKERKKRKKEKKKKKQKHSPEHSAIADNVTPNQHQV